MGPRPGPQPSLDHKQTLKIRVDSLGRYVIPNLPTGNTYMVTPVLSGYTFTPPRSTFLIGTTTTLVTKNFTAVHP